MPSIIIHVLIALLLPPLLIGIIAKTKAAFGGRVGPPWLQAYYDLIKLFQKGAVFSTTTTWIFRFGAVVSLATAALAVLIIPIASAEAPIAFKGDFVLFAAVLALGRFFLMLAALDTGSSFEGMGAAREATFACFAEPVLFFGMLVLARITHRTELTEMLGISLVHQWATFGPSILLILLSWFIVMLAENCRIPFDDPNTHLELTMIHEVMVLDHSGPPFGMILYGAAIKLFVFATLIVNLIFPFNADYLALDWIIFIAGVLLVAVLIGVVESVMARLRMPSVPGLLFGAGVLSAFGLGLLMMGKS